MMVWYEFKKSFRILAVLMNSKNVVVSYGQNPWEVYCLPVMPIIKKQQILAFPLFQIIYLINCNSSRISLDSKVLRCWSPASRYCFLHCSGHGSPSEHTHCLHYSHNNCPENLINVNRFIFQRFKNLPFQEKCISS